MNVIGGRWQASHVGATYARVNPADPGDVIGHYPDSAAPDAAAAVHAAAEAFPGWRATSAAARSAVLLRAAADLRSRTDAVAAALTREEGKPLGRARGEVDRAADVLEYFAGAALRTGGSTLPSTRPGVALATAVEPLGPVLLITPFNFPLFISALKLGPALVAGNTVVWKPSPLVPESSMALLEALDVAGIPPGVVNLVHGTDPALGRALVDDPRIRGISFTGSTTVGLEIGAAAARRHVPVQQEMGGKNVLVVGPGYDARRAAAVAIESAFGESGQKCTAAGLVVVARRDYDDVLAAVEAALGDLVIGDGRAEGVDLGPLVSQSAAAKVAALVGEELQAGSHLELVGGVSDASRKPDGCYVDPHVVRLGDGNGGPLRSVEVFGPVMSVVVADDPLTTGLDLVAANGLGLSAALLTDRLGEAQAFLERAQAGLVSINLPTTGVEHQAAFGGWNLSGGPFPEGGPRALDFYTRVKTTAVFSAAPEGITTAGDAR
jgi:aldehyde dehydrogenase (NAD+)